MGNKNIKPISSFSDWERVQAEGDIEIFKHKKSNQLGEKRSITLDPHYDLENQLKIYHMRQNNNDSLVKAYGAEELKKKSHSQGICSGHKKLEVITQKIPYRLSDLPQLTFPQILLFLRESLRGYFRVFKSYGPIHITKKLIGINQFGQVRCWINQNWALNHPNNDLPTLQTTKLQSFSQSTEVSGGSEAYDARYRDETEMVHNIIAVIEEKCEEGKFPKAFSQEVEQHSGSFKKLSTYVQDFIGINELFIPPKINFETIFVSKYETRLAQQHQQSRRQQLSANKGQYSVESGSGQGQNFITKATIGGQNNVGFVTGNGYQGYSGQKSYGYGGISEWQQRPQMSQGGYTFTNLTTTTYGGNTAYNNTSTPTPYMSSYQTATLPSSSSTNTPLPWQKPQSINKLSDAQNSYTSYQYSATNPSSVSGMNSYSFGVNSLTSGNDGKTFEPYKQTSYSSAFGNGFSGSYGNYSSSSGLRYGNNTITSLDNKFADYNNNSSTTYGIGESNNPSTLYQNLARYTNNNDQKLQYQTKVSPQISSSLNVNKNLTDDNIPFQDYKRSFYKVSGSTGLNSQQYFLNTHQKGKTYEPSSASYHKENTYEPLASDKASSNFSFDGVNNYATKFSQFSTKGYSNTLASYDGTVNSNADKSNYNSISGPLHKIKQDYDGNLKSQNQLSSNPVVTSKVQENQNLHHA